MCRARCSFRPWSICSASEVPGDIQFAIAAKSSGEASANAANVIVGRLVFQISCVVQAVSVSRQ